MKAIDLVNCQFKGKNELFTFFFVKKSGKRNLTFVGISFSKDLSLMIFIWFYKVWL